MWELGHEARACEAEVKQSQIFGPWLKVENKVISPMFTACEEKIGAYKKNRKPLSSLKANENGEVVWRLPKQPKITCSDASRLYVGKENTPYSLMVNNSLESLQCNLRRCHYYLRTKVVGCIRGLWIWRTLEAS